MNENNHESGSDPLEARLQTLRLTGFPSLLLERLLVVHPPPVRPRFLSRRIFSTGAVAVLLLAATLILTRPGRQWWVVTTLPIMARESPLPPSVSTGHRLIAPRTDGTFGVVATVPRESLAAYQRAAARGDEALMAMLNLDAATALPSLAVTKPLSPLDYRLFEND